MEDMNEGSPRRAWRARSTALASPFSMVNLSPPCTQWCTARLRALRALSGSAPLRVGLGQPAHLADVEDTISPSVREDVARRIGRDLAGVTGNRPSTRESGRRTIRESRLDCRSTRLFPFRAASTDRPPGTGAPESVVKRRGPSVAIHSGDRRSATSSAESRATERGETASAVRGDFLRNAAARSRMS